MPGGYYKGGYYVDASGKQIGEYQESEESKRRKKRKQEPTPEPTKPRVGVKKALTTAVGEEGEKEFLTGSWFQRLADSLYGGSENYQTAMETQRINLEAYEGLTTLGKIKFWGESALLSAGTVIGVTGTAGTAIGATRGYFAGIPANYATKYRSLQVGEMMVTPTAGAAGMMIANNPANQALITKATSNMGAFSNAAVIAIGILGTYALSGFIAPEEAAQTTDFGFRAYINARDYEGAQKALDMKYEVLYGMNSLKDKVPIANVVSAVDKYAAASKVTLDAQKIYLQNLIDGTDKYSMERQQRIEDEKKASELFNKASKENKQALLDLQREYDTEKNAEYKKILAENMALQKKQSIELIRLKEESAKRIRDLWSEYQKVKFDNMKSNLKFGLI